MGMVGGILKRHRSYLFKTVMHYLKLFVILKFFKSYSSLDLLELLYQLEFGRRGKEMKRKVIG